MLSKFNLKNTLPILLLMFCACTPSADVEDENIIGLRLSDLDSISESQNEKMLNIYDKVTNRIHTFDVEKNALLYSTEVPSSDGENYVVASDDDSYFISLSSFGFDFHTYQTGEVNSYGMIVQGELVSYAFNKETMHLVVYDDLNSIGLAKIESGLDYKVWVGGPLITGEQSVQAGDILDDGTLVLSLINGSLAMVDIDASISAQEWVYTEDSTLTDVGIKWIANAGGSKILVNSEDSLTLYDTAAQTVLDSVDLPTSAVPVEYSKSGSPHIVFKSKDFSTHTLAYVDSETIKTIDFTNLKTESLFSQSRLDVNANSWTYLSLERDILDWGESRIVDFNASDENRMTVTRRLSDLLVMDKLELPDEAILKRTKNRVLALYPSELGFAKVYGLNGQGHSELSNFNIPFITPELNLKPGE